MEGYKVLEIGGGSNPSYSSGVSPKQHHINLDARKVAGVDVVHDLSSLPLPFPSESFSKVYSRYVTEHLPFAVQLDLIKELHRLLKPGGRIYLVSSNLLQQAEVLSRELLKVDESNVELYVQNSVGMVFGGQDYDENTHKGSMSPKLAEYYFKKAGFKWTKIYEYWQWTADFVLEAEK